MICLGIEGTAHTIGVGIVDDECNVLSNLTKMIDGSKGGIHPREAANHHAENIVPLMHSALDNNYLDQVAPLNSALAGLKAEQETLENIQTWPWPTGVLTGFISAIVLPIVLFLLQFFIGNWLSQ